ncbi:peptidase domain-containing ABC transporter [Moraxella sp. ZY200743]|uniref:peptidase domain-containing ABC transporter n=1 Tax=Moraxella sp. ZY200743 TaxID=2911970 RepID=UPI003D7C3CC1
MDFLKRINFGLSAKMPVILQTESAECGLACLAMIAHYHGYLTDLWSLRQKYPISQKGATLHTLIKIARQIKLSTRPLRLELNELNQLRTPCILHWDMNHFVVLKSVSKTKITILDRSAGQRLMTLQEASDHFTGIALEVWADSDFEKKEDKVNIRLSKLIGEIKGLYKSLGQILILALVLEIFALTSPFFMQWVIDHAIVSADKDLLTTLVIGFGILMFLTQLTSLLQSWISMYISTTLNIQWKSNVFHHLTHLPSQFFQKRHLGDIISRFGAIDSIQSTLTTTFLTVVLDGVMTVFTLVLMFFYSPALAWVAVGAMMIYGLLRFLWYTPLKQATEEQIIHAAKQSTHFMETMHGIRAIKRFNKEDIRKSTWLTLFVNTINAGLYTQKLGLMFGFINGIIFGFENLIIIYLGANLVIDGTFTVGILMAFIAYKNQFGGRVSNLIDKFIEVKMLNLHGERLADIVLEKTEKNSYLPLIEQKDKLVYDIQVNNLSFAYNDDEPYIIDNLSFHIKDKESVAIVGATGCGKSTLMSLLMGELTPKSGEIKIAGKVHHSMAELNARDIIACVSQDDTLFAGSLVENISFFDDKPDNEWVEKCAIMAGIHDEIMSMPMGYQTLVGDMGNILSGGQKQRIFIARALYRRPKILFLDEATSHLDVKKEHQINKMIKSLGITRVMIAHRPETIKSADWVLYL